MLRHVRRSAEKGRRGEPEIRTRYPTLGHTCLIVYQATSGQAERVSSAQVYNVDPGGNY
jgi:hypothetical protein